MSNPLSGRAVRKPLGGVGSCSRSNCWRNRRNDDHGFTLVELLIVLVILPVVVGALSYGLLSIFSLQSGVSNRLTDTEDAQVVAASYTTDVQSAYNITTNGTETDSCGTITGQILGLELDEQSNQVPGEVVSYVIVPVSSTAVSLERLQCDTATNATATTESTLAFDVSAAIQPVVDITCATAFVGSSTVESCQQAAANGWISAFEFSQIVLPVTEASKGNYAYTLVAAPAAATSASNEGSQLTPTATTTSCSFASAGSGEYAGNLCFVDFSSVTGGAMTAATDGGCLEMSANVGGGNTLYFCLSISGQAVAPHVLPTYQEGFLGNTDTETNPAPPLPNVPFYIDVPGEPALYNTNDAGGATTITFSSISVVTASGELATGWQLFSADAESTDSGEYLKWTTTPSTAPLTILANGLSVDTATDPVGNACGSGEGLYYISPSNVDYPFTTGGASNGGKYNSVECEGSGTVNGNTFSTTGNDKDGVTMVVAPQPETLTVNMQANGLQGIVLGLFES